MDITLTGITLLYIRIGNRGCKPVIITNFISSIPKNRVKDNGLTVTVMKRFTCGGGISPKGAVGNRRIAVHISHCSAIGGRVVIENTVYDPGVACFIVMYGCAIVGRVGAEDRVRDRGMALVEVGDTCPPIGRIGMEDAAANGEMAIIVMEAGSVIKSTALSCPYGES